MDNTRVGLRGAIWVAEKKQKASKWDTWIFYQVGPTWLVY